MENFSKEFKNHATKIINYEKKDKWRKSIISHTKICYMCKNEFSTNDYYKKHHKVRDYCHCTGKYRGAAHNIFNLR